MFLDYFYILFLFVYSSFVGCLAHDAFVILLDEFCKYVNQRGYNAKSVFLLMGFIAVMLLILAIPSAIFAFAAYMHP